MLKKIIGLEPIKNKYHSPFQITNLNKYWNRTLYIVPFFYFFNVVIFGNQNNQLKTPYLSRKLNAPGGI